MERMRLLSGHSGILPSFLPGVGTRLQHDGSTLRLTLEGGFGFISYVGLFAGSADLRSFLAQESSQVAAFVSAGFAAVLGD